MAKKAYIGVGGVARKVKKMYVGIKGGYTMIDFIQSSGTQYIDTGFIAKNDTKVVLDCDITFSSGSSWDMIMGSYDSSAWFSWWASAGHIDPYYASSYQQTTAPSGRTTLIADENNWTANGTTMTFSDSTFTATSTVYLFSIHNGGSFNNASMKLYGCQIYDSGTLVRDFAPCKNSSGEIGLYDRVNGKFYGNAGTGDFTAGSETGEVITTGSVARNIKKGYIGIGGVARPFFGGDGLVKYGYITPLSAARIATKPANVDGHALIIGGYLGTVLFDTVDAYDASLIRKVAPTLSSPTWGPGTANAGNYALVAGGRIASNNNFTDKVEAYNASITKISAPSLASKKYYFGCTSISNNALFGGGFTDDGQSSIELEAYNSSLTKFQTLQMKYAKASIAESINGIYALFISPDNETNYSCRVTGYNASLTQLSLSETLSGSYGCIGSEEIGGYSIFISIGTPSPSIFTDAFNSSLTKITVTPLSVWRNGITNNITVLDKYAIVMGGNTGPNLCTDVVEMYDTSLTRTIGPSLGIASFYSCAVTIGNYALSCGGYNIASKQALDSVEAYTIA